MKKSKASVKKTTSNESKSSEVAGLKSVRFSIHDAKDIEKSYLSDELKSLQLSANLFSIIKSKKKK